MGDGTISIIFNLMYLIFWAAVVRKMQRKLGNGSLSLAPRYSFSQRIGQWRGHISRLGNQKWA
jgi:hypothetical protein